MKLLSASMFALIASAAQVAVAAPVLQTTVQYNTGFTVSATDLLQTNLAGTSYTGNFRQEDARGTAAFNDGIYGTQGNQAGWQPSGSHAATADGANVAVFNLTGAFDLTGIDTFAGWDRYRGGQEYTVSYATSANPLNYTELTRVYLDAKEGGNVNTRVTIRDSATAFLARDVVSLRFDFGGNLTYGYSGYREIDVFGTAVPRAEVPEPASIALLGLGLAGIAFLRRRARRA
jgi:hypothetical protein